MNEAQARASLSQAFDLIRQGQYDRARDELRRVSRSLPNTQLGREADRGGAAIYNARQIAEASVAERASLAARARKSLERDHVGDAFLSARVARSRKASWSAAAKPLQT